MFRLMKLPSLAVLALSTLLALPVHADDTHPFATQHYVLQVSQNDPARWNLAMNNAQNLQSYYGPDKVEVVIVAYGPGLNMLLKDSKVAGRVKDQAMNGIEFDACHNTMKGMAKKLGHMPAINPAAKVVPAGVVRIGELESKGYVYLKP